MATRTETLRRQKSRGSSASVKNLKQRLQKRVTVELVLDLESHIDPMSHMGFQGARHMHPERMPTKQQERATNLRLFDIRPETIENVQKISETIKRLMIPGLSIKSVPDNLVNNLINLERLDIGHNNLTDGGLPEGIKKLENLVELNLTDNKLTKFPACIRRLKNLSRLDLSHNSLESLQGLEKIRRVQILVVDHNKLSTIFKDISHLKRLEILRCSNNNIQEIGQEIRQLKYLKDIDLSDNNITMLPTDVFLLPKLDALNVSRNSISKVPSFNIQVHNKHWVSEIDMSENDLSQFPGHLLHMCHKVDLSCNKIKVLDMNAMKQLEKFPENDLVVDDNPLTFPPPEISGLNAILHYLHEARLNATVYRGLKVIVLGSQQSGKTSLVQSLVDEQSRLALENGDKTSGIEAYDMRMEYPSDDAQDQEKYLQLCIWDFCGHPFYLFPHYLFFEQPSITILTFNMKQYTPERFDELIGSWFDWMIAKTNKLVVLLVGTHGDLVPKQKVKQITADVKAQMDEFKRNHQKLIKDRIAKIDAIPEIKPTHSDQLISLNKLLACMDSLVIQTDVLVTSARSYVGFDHLRNALDQLANNKTLFPSVMSEVPTFWVDVQNYIEEKGNDMVVPVMKWENYFDEMTEKFGMKRMMNDITSYLHETGRVIWFKKNPILSKYVFLRPSWLFEILRNVYCHDHDTTLTYDVDDSFKSLGFSTNRFERFKKQLLNEGIMESEFLKGILGKLLPLNESAPYEEVERLLIEAFECGYAVSKKKDGALKLDIELEKDTKITKVLMPWLRKIDDSEESIHAWESLATKRKLAALLRFPKYMPPGMFELICVRCQRHKDSKKNENDQKESVPSLKLLSHWGGGFIAEHTDKPVLVKVHFTRGEIGHGADIIYEIRDNTSEDAYEETPACDMWVILLPLLMLFEELLKEYQGMMCPGKHA